MDPNVWGPHAWIFLHSITLNYPLNPTKKDIKHYYNFFTNLKYILPCDKCRYHYTQNLIKYPLTNKILLSKKNLINWLINIHNSVNKLNNKKIYSYNQVINIYNKLYNPNNKIIGQYIIVIILFLLAFYICFSNKLTKIYNT